MVFVFSDKLNGDMNGFSMIWDHSTLSHYVVHFVIKSNGGLENLNLKNLWTQHYHSCGVIFSLFELCFWSPPPPEGNICSTMFTNSSLPILSVCCYGVSNLSKNKKQRSSVILSFSSQSGMISNGGFAKGFDKQKNKSTYHLLNPQSTQTVYMNRKFICIA